MDGKKIWTREAITEKALSHQEEARRDWEAPVGGRLGKAAFGLGPSYFEFHRTRHLFWNTDPMTYRSEEETKQGVGIAGQLNLPIRPWLDANVAVKLGNVHGEWNGYPGVTLVAHSRLVGLRPFAGVSYGLIQNIDFSWTNKPSGYALMAGVEAPLGRSSFATARGSCLVRNDEGRMGLDLELGHWFSHRTAGVLGFRYVGNEPDSRHSYYVTYRDQYTLEVSAGFSLRLRGSGPGNRAGVVFPR